MKVIIICVEMLFILGLDALLENEKIDWCNIGNCEVNTHIACNNDGSWYPNCVDYYSIPLLESAKELIVDKHNFFRNQIASGNVTGYPKALRMGQLSWDDDLAWLAQLNTKQCSMNHDVCRNTPSYDCVGQNLYLLYSVKNPSVEKVIENMSSKWFNEWNLGEVSDIERFTEQSLEKGIGHFTQMVQEKASKVGCAMSSFWTLYGLIQYRGYLIACNYDYSNMKNSPVYKFGDSAAGCKTGSDDVLSGLCSKAEKIF